MSLDTAHRGAPITLAGLVGTFQVLQEGFRPPIRRMLADIVVRDLQTLLFFLLGHVYRQVYVLSYLIHIEGVDFEYATKCPVTARELRYNDRGLILPLQLLLDGYELQGREALPIPEGGNHQNISHGPQGYPLFHQQILLLIMNRTLPELLLYLLHQRLYL